MAITRWDPFAELASMERNMDRLWSRWVPSSAGSETGGAVWMPTTDVFTRGGDMIVRAELPGVDPKNVDISVTNDILTITGQRAEDKEAEEKGYMMRESFRGAFERSIALPAGIDANSLKASFHHGVLEVTVPKGASIQETKTHHIPLSSSTETGTR